MARYMAFKTNEQDPSLIDTGLHLLKHCTSQFIRAKFEIRREKIPQNRLKIAPVLHCKVHPCPGIVSNPSDLFSHQASAKQCGRQTPLDQPR